MLTLTAAGTAAAVGYGLTAPKQYRATAQLLVSPVSVNDPTFTGLDVLRDSSGKRTAAASAAALLRSPQVADVVRADLGLARSRDSLLSALDAHVVGSSDVVAVTVQDTSAAGAAQLANAFADGLVKQRTASFQSQLATTIRRDQQLLNAITPGQRATGAGAELQKRLAVLQGFQGQPDPTIRHAGQASAPASPSWPKLPRLAAIGAGAGLAAGLLAALVIGVGRFLRRPRVERDASYDGGVSERLVERLEQRVTERVAALEEERQRLSAREAALAARERDVSAKLDELRVAIAAAPDSSGGGAALANAAAVEALAARAAALDGRLMELTEREMELARRTAELAEQEQGKGTEAESADRLAAREAALAEREEEAAAKLDELRAALAAVPEAPVADTSEAEELLAGRSAVLDARVAELTQRELGLARRAAEVAKREHEAAARMQELARQVPEPPDEAAVEALAERSAALDARVAELTQRELGLARRAAEVAKREEEAAARTEELALRAAQLGAQLEEAKLEEAERATAERAAAERAAAELEEADRAAIAARDANPEPAAAPQAPLTAAIERAQSGPPAATAAKGARGAWNLIVLERLVAGRVAEFPDKRDEWISYLYFLREYAEPDGTIPSSFDWLIQDTFAELVA